MAKKKVFTLAWLAILLLACSLTNGATLSAAQIKPALITATAPPSPTPYSSPTLEPELCTVTAEHLNFRACAGTDCLVLDVLEKGDLLTVLEREDWYNVQLSNGRIGYIKSTYCTIGEIRK